MKFKEFISIELNDLDVGNDYSDTWYDCSGKEFDAYIAFCCGPDSPLTEDGLKEFESIMDFDVTVGRYGATVHIPGKTDDEKQENLNKVMTYFYAHAGYIGISLYNKWFN